MKCSAISALVAVLVFSSAVEAHYVRVGDITHHPSEMQERGGENKLPINRAHDKNVQNRCSDADGWVDEYGDGCSE